MALVALNGVPSCGVRYNGSSAGTLLAAVTEDAVPRATLITANGLEPRVIDAVDLQQQLGLIVSRPVQEVDDPGRRFADARVILVADEDGVVPELRGRPDVEHRVAFVVRAESERIADQESRRERGIRGSTHRERLEL